MKIKKYIHLYCESGVVPVSNGMDDFFNIMARLTTEEFIERAREVHGDKYDYSKVEYKSAHTKVCIICPEHGEFWQTPNAHLYLKCGCSKCMKNVKGTTDEFIERSRKIHSNKYDYSKVEYINSKTKVCIICPKHGEFWQKPNGHLNGQGCPSCNKITSDDFIQKATLIHNGKYDYSKVDYKTAKTKVCIICPEHGEFWQAPGSHLSGKGCPHCLSSKIEDTIETKLNEMNVNFEKQKTFNWLKSKRNMRLDFYLPEYNIAIECQGKQHFDNIEYFGGNDGLKYRKYNDMIKLKLCKEHNVNLLYFNYDDDINKFEQKLKEYGIF